MTESDSDYHVRRAATQRSLAERCANPAAATAHRTLADLHDMRARKLGGRPVLRMATPH